MSCLHGDGGTGFSVENLKHARPVGADRLANLGRPLGEVSGASTLADGGRYSVEGQMRLRHHYPVLHALSDLVGG